MSTDIDRQKPAAQQRGFPWILLTLSGLALVVLIALGNWQVKRLAWKEDLLSTMNARIHAEPVAITELYSRLEEGDDIEYTPVTVTGRFIHEGTGYFFATHQGQSGWYVYTPLAITEGSLAGEAVIINRGFVPYDMRDPAARPGSEPEGELTITGLARERLAQKPGMAPDNKPQERTFFWKDWSAMAELGALDTEETVPFFIDAGFPDTDYPVDELPRPGVTLIDLPNNHLQYAVTWYGLALTLAGVTGVFLWRRWRDRPSA